MTLQHKLSSQFIRIAVISAISAAFAGIPGFTKAAQASETFSVDGGSGGMALNTNTSFRRIDGQPRMSIWTRNDNDPDQLFDRLPGNQGGTLLRHRSTGKCMNAHYLSNGSEFNVWDCNANDPDQNFVITSAGNGYSQIRRVNTNFCVDASNRINGGTVHLWTCDVNNPNQRWRSNQSGGSTSQAAEAFFTWANGQYNIQRLDRSDLGGQCVTLVVRYLQDVFFNHSTASRAYGNGKDVAQGVATQHSNLFEPITTTGLPRRGAIISFRGPNTVYGHVGIVMESRTDNGVRQVRILESNWDNRAPNTTVRLSGWISISSYGGTNGWTNPR